jgi:hypothetical protein
MLKIGTLVVSKTRHPSAHQPWIHEVYVGRVIEPGDNPEDWNKHNSERHYCELMGYAKVQYEWGTSHDTWEDLIPITEEQAALTPIEKVYLFVGEEAAETWIRHSSPKEAERARELIEKQRKLHT